MSHRQDTLAARSGEELGTDAGTMPGTEPLSSSEDSAASLLISRKSLMCERCGYVLLIDVKPGQRAIDLAPRGEFVAISNGYICWTCDQRAIQEGEWS